MTVGRKNRGSIALTVPLLRATKRDPQLVKLQKAVLAEVFSSIGCRSDRLSRSVLAKTGGFIQHSLLLDIVVTALQACFSWPYVALKLFDARGSRRMSSKCGAPGIGNREQLVIAWEGKPIGLLQYDRRYKHEALTHDTRCALEMTIRNICGVHSKWERMSPPLPRVESGAPFEGRTDRSERHPASEDERLLTCARIASNYRLTPTEAEVFRYLMGAENRNENIAKCLGNSVGAVEQHLTHIYRKLGCAHDKRQGAIRLFWEYLASSRLRH